MRLVWRDMARDDRLRIMDHIAINQEGTQEHAK